MRLVTFVVQVLALAGGLAAGALWPRRAPLVSGESLVNLATGALLYPLRYGLGLAGAFTLNLGLVPLGTLGHPALQLLFTFLVLDFTRYWVHYADHRVPWLWTFHRVHHSVEHMDATVGFRMHLVDFLQLTGLIVLLFGVVFDISRFEAWVLPAALSVGIVADAVEHANVHFPLDTAWRRAWFRVFNTPLFHSWHHVRDATLCDGNYANALPLWDRLFGTEVTRPEPPAEFGLTADQALEPSILGLQLLTPRKKAAAVAGSAAGSATGG